MALDGRDYMILTVVALMALLLPLVGSARRARRRRWEGKTNTDDPLTRLELLKDSRGELLAEFIPMSPIGDIEELRAFQSRWLQDSHPSSSAQGHALRHEDRYYWDIVLVGQPDGPRLAVHFSITGQLYVALSPLLGRAAN